MANMIPISTVVVGSGGSTNIQFTSIPQIYTDLLIKVSSRQSNVSIGLKMDINSSSAFSGKVIEGTGSSYFSYNMTNQYLAGYNNISNATASTFGNTDIYIPNYTSIINKSVSAESVTENNGTAAYMALFSTLYTTSSPITSITLSCDNGGSFTQYSSATLYGIRKY